LAQRLYVNHLNLLKSEIKALEEDFLVAHKDIEAIERGDWDEKFQKQLEEQAQPTAVVPATPGNESIGTPASGTKRTRGGRRKGLSPSATPMSVDEDGDPPAKRSRTGTEIETTEEATEAKDVEPEQVEQEPEPMAVEEEEAAEEGEAEAKEEPVVEAKVEEEDESVTPTQPPEVVDAVEDEGHETEAEVDTKPEPSATKSPSKQESSEPESDGASSSYDSNAIAELTPSRPKQKSFSTLISPLHAGLSSLRSATLFSQPIREMDAPGYYELVKRPVDLKTLWKQVKDGIVPDSKVFHREVARMFANAIMYNKENCDVLVKLD
jgi:hypothetical protein